MHHSVHYAAVLVTEVLPMQVRMCEQFSIIRTTEIYATVDNISMW